MYRRGKYFKHKYRFPLLPKEVAAIIAVVVAGVSGSFAFAQADAHWAQTSATDSSAAVPQWWKQLRRLTKQSTGADTASSTPTTAPTANSSSTSGATAAGPASGGSATQPASSTGQDLASPQKKEIAMRLVSSAENSSTDWKAQYSYIEDIGDGRGYTAGLVGFCSGTGDMLALVQQYTTASPNNVLAAFLPALKAVNGSASTAGLGSAFVAAWKQAATDTVFQKAQDSVRDTMYFNPAVAMAKADGLSILGQFAYYDAAVMHGPDAWGGGMPNIRQTAVKSAKTPAQGGDEKAYLEAFLAARKVEMAKEAAHRDVSRIDGIQQAFLNQGNMTLALPLTWKVYGDTFSIPSL